MHRFLMAGVLALSVAALALGQPGPFEKFAQEVPKLGHRNWVVIADSAYPAQTRPGIETIVVDADHLDVVKDVLGLLENSKHVKPIVYTDEELKFVPEADARGIGEFRRALKGTLGRREVKTLPHEQLIARLDKAGETYRVIIIKTPLKLPYTSVFLELDCGYWTPEAEKRLREAMKKAEPK